MDELKPIRVFLEVARQLSFSKAAAALRMTPASVTRIVASLEERLNQQLLLRTTRQVSLTSAGRAVVDRYSALVREFDQVTEELMRVSRPDFGRLRLNAPLSLGMRVLPDLIESFHLAYPQVDVQVHLTDALVDIIATDCDLAIRVSGPPKDKSTIWRKLCEVPRYLVASPSLFDRIERPQTPSDLNANVMLSYSEDETPELWEFRKGQEKRLLRAGTHVVSNNGDFLYGLVRAGGGICLLPDFLVRGGLDRGDVEVVLPEWIAPSLWLTLFYPPYQQLPPVVSTFAHFAESYILELDGMVDA